MYVFQKFHIKHTHQNVTCNEFQIDLLQLVPYIYIVYVMSYISYQINIHNWHIIKLEIHTVTEFIGYVPLIGSIKAK